MVCLHNTLVRLWVKPCREDSPKTNSQESKDGIFEITIKLFCQRVDTF